MQGKLSLDRPLADCVVGEAKEITLSVTPTKNDADGFEADVQEVVDYEEEKDEAPAKPVPPKGALKPTMAPAAMKAAGYSE